MDARLRRLKAIESLTLAVDVPNIVIIDLEHLEAAETYQERRGARRELVKIVDPDQYMQDMGGIAQKIDMDIIFVVDDI